MHGFRRVAYRFSRCARGFSNGKSEFEGAASRISTCEDRFQSVVSGFRGSARKFPGPASESRGFSGGFSLGKAEKDYPERESTSRARRKIKRERKIGEGLIPADETLQLRAATFHAFAKPMKEVTHTAKLFTGAGITT